MGSMSSSDSSFLAGAEENVELLTEDGADFEAETDGKVDDRLGFGVAVNAEEGFVGTRTGTSLTGRSRSSSSSVSDTVLVMVLRARGVGLDGLCAVSPWRVGFALAGERC